MSQSEYDKIKADGFKRGRKRLSPAEQEERKRHQLLRQEGRRRAIAVLQHRHYAEFIELWDAEMAVLLSESKAN
jgi:hypothetical protein